MNLPKAVQNIIHILEGNGYEAYAVGGCVRDLFLGREPQDWDVTTSAKPMEVKRIFHRTVDTGIQHGTVTVLMEGKGYEVTTYRIDGAYSDHRHPEEVRFTSALEEDLKRRDFTVNAMAYNEEAGIVDLFHGREDLKNGVIRAVGDPEERFTEDALRILRAFRFSAQLDFVIEENTLKAASKLSGNLVYVSRERVREELLKLLLSDHPDRLTALYKAGALAGIFPRYPEEDRALIRTLELLKNDPVRRLSGLLYYFAPDAKSRAAEGKKLLMELRFDNDTRDRVVKILSLSDSVPSSDAADVRALLSKSGPELFASLVDVLEAVDTAGKSSPDAASGNSVENSPGADSGNDRGSGEAECSPDPVYEEMRQEAAGILARGECISIGQLALNGNDLLSLGVKPGKAIGDTLNALLEEVLKDPALNEKETLKGLIKKD